MEDVGGDPACWVHRFDDQRRDIATRRDVELLVRTFYRAAAMDDILGPVFRAAHVDWPDHIAVVSEFWMDQLFGTAEYEGNPLRAHVPVDWRTPLTGAHFGALPRLLRGRPDPGSSPIEVRWRR